ncbi:MAG TPA: glycosyltransferase 87 family protein [Dongiaceae bacterium]|nr:glycosyltransferase 87 family protein [Dongiaceae bacterium]
MTTSSTLGRRLAWLLAPAILALLVALNPLNRPTYVMGDFRAFYCAGAAIAQHANPYLEEPLRGCEAQAGPPAEPAFLRPVALPAPLPPYALALFVPFGLLPFPLAAVLYGLLMIAAMTAATALFARVTSVSSVVLNIVFAAITATVTYYVGQPVPLVFLALAGAALFARGGRWWAAGACAVAASIEPHVALPALVAMLVALPRTRLPIVIAGALFGAVGILAVGLPTTVAYVRDVVPAHALANAFEWQFSLTSVLTSLGVAAPLAIRCGELMFAAMVALGVAVAVRLRALTGDAAVIVLIPPAFGVFGGVHVHFQQLAVAFPAILYVYARYPRVRALAAGGLGLAMIPWNVMSSTVLAGLSPLLAGAFGLLTVGRRGGLALSAAAALIGFSLLALALAGLGPPPAHFVAHAYPPGALAEASWGDFSRSTLMRPSLMMQWLRVPTLVGIASGLAAIVRVACSSPLRSRSVSPRSIPAVPAAS